MESIDTEAIEPFRTKLRDIRKFQTPPLDNSSKFIDTLAKEVVQLDTYKYYKHIVTYIDEFIVKCPSEFALFGLLLADAVIRRSAKKGNFKIVHRFETCIVNDIKKALQKAPEDQKNQIISLIKTWEQNEMFDLRLLRHHHDSSSTTTTATATTQSIMRHSPPDCPQSFPKDPITIPLSPMDESTIDKKSSPLTKRRRTSVEDQEYPFIDLSTDHEQSKATMTTTTTTTTTQSNIDQQPEQPSTCTICLEPIIKGSGTLDGCPHIFDFTCIQQWSKVTNLCPLCKAEFRLITKHESGKKPRKFKIKPKKQEVEVDPRDYIWDTSDDEEDYNTDDAMNDDLIQALRDEQFIDDSDERALIWQDYDQGVYDEDYSDESESDEDGNAVNEIIEIEESSEEEEEKPAPKRPRTAAASTTTRRRRRRKTTTKRSRTRRTSGSTTSLRRSTRSATVARQRRR